MVDDILEQLISRTVQYCADEKNRDRIIKPLELFVAERFAWIVRCFEIMASLAIVQTALLVYVIVRLHARRD